MKHLLVLAFLLASCLASNGQTVIELSLGDGERASPARLSPEFDPSGEFLFTILGKKIRVFATKDGSLVREYSLPVGDEPPERDRVSLSSFYQRGQISLAFGGKYLLAICDGFTDQDGVADAIFLIDVEQLIEGREIRPISIRYPSKASHQPLRYVCTLGDDRVVFVTRNRTHDDRLMIYRLGDERIDSGSIVELNSKASRTPEYLCCGVFGSPLTYLVGPSRSQSSVVALRVVPESEKTRAWQEIQCDAEKIEISWNDRGYGSTTSVGTYRLPALPVAVSPNLERFMVSLERPISGSHYRQTIGITSFENPQRVSTMHSTLAEEARTMGRPGLWSRNGERFFINDGNQSQRKRARSISVHDASGSRIGVLPLGSGVAAEVLATSVDGRLIVTRMDLYLRPRPKTRTPDRFASAVFALWDLR